MRYVITLCLLMDIISVYALTPRAVRSLRTEFTSVLAQENPDFARAQKIIQELRAGKEARSATELEKDLHAARLRVAGQTSERLAITAQTADSATSLQIKKLQRLSLQVIDSINLTDALLGQAMSAAEHDDQLKAILDKIAQQHNALRAQRDEIVHLALAL